MHDGIDRTILDQAAHRLLLTTVGLDELDVAVLPEDLDGLDVPMFERIDDRDPATRFQQAQRGVRADIAGTAGHKNAGWRRKHGHGGSRP